MFKYLFVMLAIISISAAAFAQPDQDTGSTAQDNVSHLQNFPVIEFRRYPVAPGERQHFAKYFDTYFPGAFEQSGAIAFGQFLERGDNIFTWIRGFHTYNERAVDEAAFYYGPLWQEIRVKINALLPGVDDNVLLLHPLRADTGIPVLPMVDPVTDSEGAQGVVVAQIFSVKKGQVKAFVHQADSIFARYRASGAHQAGILVTLDEPTNDFPILPYRTDGPFLVWLGVLKNNQMLETRFEPVEKAALPKFSADGLLRKAPELLILDPTHRSRLRWLPQWNH